MSYAQIVEGCRRHKPDAQRALYDATASMAMGVCMRYAGSRTEAQDMMQDGYVKVYERIASLKEPEKLLTWVYTVMTNTCITACRKSQRERLTDDLEPLAPPLNLNPYLMQDIVEAMQQLSPRERAVFNLFNIEGYSIGEVAEKTGSTGGAVRVMLTRARSKMRSILEK